VRVLLYASVVLFGESLGACLIRNEEVSEVIVEHESLDLAQKTQEFDPDIVLFDVTPKLELRTIRSLVGDCPETPIVALAVPHIAEEVIACAEAGCVSYVPRDASFEELIGILAMAMRGETQCEPRIARSLLEEIHRRGPTITRRDADPHLTPREIQTLRLVSRGLSNKEIAQELNLSVATVKNHVHAILGKLNLTRRGEARQLLTEQPWLLRAT